MEGLFRLPAELRARIWQYSLPEPRHIILSQRRTRIEVPVIFHICRESRSEAQRFYLRAPLSFGNQRTSIQGRYVWIDLSRDTICPEEDALLSLTDHDTMMATPFKRAQRLAFEFSPPQNFMQLLEVVNVVYHHLPHLPALREVVLYSPPKKWFENLAGGVQERHPPLTDPQAASKILLRLLHMLFGGHAWLDSGAGIPPPLRWEFVCNAESNVWAGPFSDREKFQYVFRCASTGKFEIQEMGWDDLGKLQRVEGKEARVHHLVGCYEGCPEHGPPFESITDDD